MCALLGVRKKARDRPLLTSLLTAKTVLLQACPVRIRHTDSQPVRGQQTRQPGVAGKSACHNITSQLNIFNQSACGTKEYPLPFQNHCVRSRHHRPTDASARAPAVGFSTWGRRWLLTQPPRPPWSLPQCESGADAGPLPRRCAASAVQWGGQRVRRQRMGTIALLRDLMELGGNKSKVGGTAAPPTFSTTPPYRGGALGRAACAAPADPFGE